MEFRFNINEIFKTPVVEIASNLVPPGFQGDRRQLWEAVTKVSEVVNTIGQASASAQGLTKPITTAERLRNAENQKLYLLIDRNSKTGKGCVTGMLKTGKKGLYVFDRDGQHFQVQPNCVLDFYIHESRQRTGLGKRLFEHMLEKEEVDPVKLAIDRPSDKFLAFLKKHYNLEAAIRQMNNYVVFEGFFPEEEKLMSQQQHSANNNTETPTNRMTTTIHLDKRGSNGLQQHAITSPYGRYGAPRPPCSMGQIIHNQSAVIGAQEPSGCSLNMKPSKERSVHTLRRGSRHANEEMTRQYYAAPRLPFTPFAAVGNGLEYSQAFNDANSNQTLYSSPFQESNIQLVTKEQMMLAAIERQKQQMKSDRPQSILQNLPSPTPSQQITKSTANNVQNASLVQQNIKLIDRGPYSAQIRPQTGLTNQQQYLQSQQNVAAPSNVHLCNAHSLVMANNQLSDNRIARPKPLISAPLKDYGNSPIAKSTVSTTNSIHQNHQYQQQQYVPPIQQSVGNNESNSQIQHWQNQNYQSRDAPTKYPFTGTQNNPNRFYVSQEEYDECLKQQEDSIEERSGYQQIPNRMQEAIVPEVQQNILNSSGFEQESEKKFPTDYQQKQTATQNQEGYYLHQQQPQSMALDSKGRIDNQMKQQTYQFNNHNIIAPQDGQELKYPPAEAQMYLDHTHQQQSEYNPLNYRPSPNMYQPLPTITETESEQAISATKQYHPQEISFQTNENAKMNGGASPKQEELIQHSPRFNPNNVSSAVISQNVGNFNVQSPRLNQYLVQQQQVKNLIPPQQQNYNNYGQNVPVVDYSQYAKQEMQNVYSAPQPLQQTQREVCYQKPRPTPSNEVHASSSQAQERISPARHTKTPSSQNVNMNHFPTQLPHAQTTPVYKDAVNHSENTCAPIEVSPSNSSSFQVAPNEKSEQVKPNCLPERTPRLNSDQASASTQINIPKNVAAASAEPIFPGYNNLATRSYKQMQQQQQYDEFCGDRGVGNQQSGHQGVSNGRRDGNSACQQGNEREPPYESYARPTSKLDAPFAPNRKGDTMAISNGGGGQQRPVEMRPEIASQ